MRPIVTDGTAIICLLLSWALQKPLNRSRCRLGCGFMCVPESTY